MALISTTKRFPDPEEVIFFRGEYFTGDAYLGRLGDRANVPARLNDLLYSVRLGVATKIILIRDYHFSGPTLESSKDVPSILLGGPGSGLSSYIVLPREGQYIARFSFRDEVSHNRSLTLISSNFNPTDQIPNPGVTIPNPNPSPGEDRFAPRVFSVLSEENDINLPIVVAIHVRRADGVFENIGALILVYLAEDTRTNRKVIKVQSFPGFDYGELRFNTQGDLINFVWGGRDEDE